MPRWKRLVIPYTAVSPFPFSRVAGAHPLNVGSRLWRHPRFRHAPANLETTQPTKPVLSWAAMSSQREHLKLKSYNTNIRNAQTHKP